MRPEFTAQELESYGLSEGDLSHLTEGDWLEMDWLRQGHKMPRSHVFTHRPVNYVNPVMKQAALKLLKRGCSNREIERSIHIHRATIANLRRAYDDIFRCRCGQKGNHRGFCSHRFRRSVKRMRFMEHFTEFSMRDHVALQIPVSRWSTYKSDIKATRSWQKWRNIHGRSIESVTAWERVFLDQRERIIDLKLAQIAKLSEASERKELVRPSVSSFFKKLAFPSELSKI